MTRTKLDLLAAADRFNAQLAAQRDGSADGGDDGERTVATVAAPAAGSVRLDLLAAADRFNAAQAARREV